MTRRKTLLKYCKQHGEYESQTAEILGRKIFIGCPQCEAEKTKKELEDLKQQEQLAIEKDYINRGIEPEFFNATLENFIPENASERKALEAAQLMASGQIKKILLIGQNGVGKTHLVSALAKIKKGRVLTMFQFSSLLRAGYNRKKTEIETIEDELLSYPLVAIDEYGLSKCSEMELNSLAYLVDKCHTRNKDIVLVSNIFTSKSAKSDAIENYIPNAVISRFRCNSVIVEVEGRDRRRATFTTL